MDRSDLVPTSVDRVPSSTRRWLVVLAAWTAFVWINRIINAWGSTTETAVAKGVSIVLATVFLAFAAATARIVWRARREPLDRVSALVLRAFAGWTVSVWLVRALAIVLADHSAGFKAVHVALAVISIGLSLPAWAAGSRRWSLQVTPG